MYRTFIKKKILSTEIWRLIVCILMLVTSYSAIIRNTSMYLGEISFIEFIILTNNIASYFLFAVPVVFLMSDIYNGNRSLYENFSYLRMRKRVNIAKAYIIYAFIVAAIVMLVIIIGEFFGYLVNFGIDENIFRCNKQISMIVSEQTLPLGNNQSLIEGIFTKLLLNYLYCLWVALFIIMVNILSKRDSLGYIFYFAERVLATGCFFVFNEISVVYIFPDMHTELSRFSISFPGYSEQNISQLSRLPYFISYMYFIFSIVLFIIIIIRIALRKDFMMQDGILR